MRWHELLHQPRTRAVAGSDATVTTAAHRRGRRGDLGCRSLGHGPDRGSRSAATPASVRCREERGSLGIRGRAGCSPVQRHAGVLVGSGERARSSTDDQAQLLQRDAGGRSVDQVAEDHDAARLPVVSVKLPGTWARDYDGWLNDLLDRLGASPAPVMLSLHTERSADGMAAATGSAFKSARSPPPRAGRSRSCRS